MSDKISREELVKIYNIEITFFDSLEESGLIKIQQENEMKSVSYTHLDVYKRQI